MCSGWALLVAPLLGWVFMAPSSSLFLLLVIRISLHHSSLADYIPKGVLLILLVLLTVPSLILPYLHSLKVVYKLIKDKENKLSSFAKAVIYRWKKLFKITL